MFLWQKIIITWQHNLCTAALKLYSENPYEIRMCSVVIIFVNLESKSHIVHQSIFHLEWLLLSKAGPWAVECEWSQWMSWPCWRSMALAVNWLTFSPSVHWVIQGKLWPSAAQDWMCLLSYRFVQKRERKCTYPRPHVTSLLIIFTCGARQY